MHDIHNLPNPVTTAVVRAALAPLIDDAPPRSWSLQEKAKFYDAPVEVREIIARRTKQRETELSRLQNENAELRRELSAQIIKTRPASNGAEPVQRTSALAARVEQVRAEANAYIDMRAADLKREIPGVPISVLRMEIVAGFRNCPCASILHRHAKEANNEQIRGRHSLHRISEAGIG